MITGVATKAIVQRAAIVILLVQSSASASEERSAPDVPFLTSDAHFSIGGHHVVLPIVALRGPDHVFSLGHKEPSHMKETLKTKASDPTNPMPVDSLNLSMRQYQYTGERIESLEICPLLTRLWAQRLCRGEHDGILAPLPTKFDLLDHNKIDLLKNHWTVGRERKYDQVKDMSLRLGVTEIGCDRASKFCTAVVETLPGLLAVWTVWSDENTGVPAAQMAETEGAAITEFVRRAIGPIEDPSFVSAN
jgi:hypothetical protein